jgi:hypothetical protein
MRTDYVDVEMSVDQFLYQSQVYVPLEEGESISQTFATQKRFSTIALLVHNPQGEYNDSTYQVTLYDAAGQEVARCTLEGKQAQDYQFYRMPFASVEGNTDYRLVIEKLAGTDCLTFLYYNTGHYDVYKNGQMEYSAAGKDADLAFEVYWRE